MRRTGIALILAVVLAACGGEPGAGPATPTTPDTPTTTVGTTTTTPPAGSTTVGLDVIVPPDDDGEFPSDLMVSCNGANFPIGALEEIRPLSEADPGGVAEAIAPFLAGEEGQFWPQDGWQILHETDEEIHLVANTDDGLLAHMFVTDDGSGWQWSGASQAGDECRARFTVPEGLNTVEWRVDPAVPPTPETTELALILNERECVGGQAIGDRLVGPQIVMTDSQVFIAFAAEPPPGDAFECPGNPDTPFTVELAEPLGDRELMEGMEVGITLEDYVD